MNKKMVLYFLLLILVAVISYRVGFDNGDPNKVMRYGDTGLPRNCRAIVYENYKGFLEEEFTADQSLDSIYRNCGEFGYSWGW